MNKKICVYCSASHDLASVYIEAAVSLGRTLAGRGDTLVYGGGSFGLMGEVSRAAYEGGGRVIGVIPKMLLSVEFASKHADELIVTEDMRERKANMETRADAFIALPGGIGTLEEVFEIMTLRSLNQTAKPLVLINVEGFYEPLVGMLRQIYSRGFMRRDLPEIFYLARDVEDALNHIDGAF